MRRKNVKGFSLVELLAVIAILGILSGLGIIAYNRYVAKARKEGEERLGKAAILAAEQYMIDHPNNTKEITLKELKEGNYINNIKCPGTNEEVNSDSYISINKNDEKGIKSLGFTTYITCINNTFSYDSEYGYKPIGNDFDITVLKNITEIKVLNIYGDNDDSATKTSGNVLNKWMNNNGANRIKVTSKNIQDFHGTEIKNADGSWNYDVIVFGFNDCNGGSKNDLKEDAYIAVNEFINSNMPVIFGHDTITEGIYCNSGNGHANFNKFKDKANVELHKARDPIIATKIKIIKDIDITNIPWQIPKTELTIPKSHTYGQKVKDKDDVAVIFVYDGDNSKENSRTEAQKSYLSVKDNVALIQTGHSIQQDQENAATSEEQKLIANLIFYMYRKYVSKSIS